MIIKKIHYYSLLLLFAFGLSCDNDDRTQNQIDRDMIIAIEDDLRNNQWSFDELTISVAYEAQAPPILALVANDDGKIQPGVYTSTDIFGNDNRQAQYRYSFTRDDVLQDTAFTDNYYKVAGYYIVNTTEIAVRDTFSTSLIYDYALVDNTFSLETSSIYSHRFVNLVNNIVLKAILNDSPSDISEKFVDFILNNEQVAKLIEQYLYDIIYGKISDITSSPEERAEEIAETIFNTLSEIDWYNLLYNYILNSLEDIVDEPEENADRIAERISDAILALLNQDDIYDTILPILEDFESDTIPVLGSKLASALYDLIQNLLSEENIYNQIYPLWEDLSAVDSTTVIEVADSLSSVVVDHFMDQDELTTTLMPFVQQIDDTPSLKLSTLAQEIIDDVLIPIVDNVNENFPALGLDPDWTSIKPYITSALTAVKAGLARSTVEELSASLASTIITLMETALQSGFETAIFKLQDVPSDEAATIIAAWVTNLIDLAEDPVVEYLSEQLDEILLLFDAQKAAETISALIYQAILEITKQENLYAVILPLIERLQEQDLELVAERLSIWIADLVSENISADELQEQLEAILASLIGNIDPDNATEMLVELILNNSIVDSIDGDLLKIIIKAQLYNALYSVAQNVNAVDGVQVSIQRIE